ncbi:hypothetical protein [Streptomyces achromogenes]|uniref:hypothetical protein n=1 Tax=Streptomyces achromogenes TaxID=67255 RepID=UPI003A8127D2
MSMYGIDPEETADALDNAAHWDAAQLMRKMAEEISDLESQLAKGRQPTADDRATQTRSEAAALLKAADYFQGVIDDNAHGPEFNTYYWNGVRYTVEGLRAQAANLLKEQ